MLNERLQILITSDQRRRLEEEARRRRVSVAGLIREAIYARFGAITPDDRLRAVEEIRGMESGRFLPPDELGRQSDAEHDEAIEALLGRIRR